MRNKYRRKAWLLDEDILLLGHVDKNGFHPKPGIQCGFGLQIITKGDINKTLFYDLDKAREVLGDIEVIDH